jgi:hypothetical protein
MPAFQSLSEIKTKLLNIRHMKITKNEINCQMARKEYSGEMCLKFFPE